MTFAKINIKTKNYFSFEQKIMTWNDITIKKYLEIQDILESEMTEDEKTSQIAYVIYGYDVSELPIPEYIQKIKELSFIKDEPPTEKIKSNYTVNGTKYIVNALLGVMQGNQFIDFQNYAKQKDMIGCISCFFIPDGHKYGKDYDMTLVKNDIGDLPIATANALAFFFKSQYAVLLVLSQRYLLKLMKMMGMSRKKLKEMQDNLTTLGMANLVATLSSLNFVN